VLIGVAVAAAVLLLLVLLLAMIVRRRRRGRALALAAAAVGDAATSPAADVSAGPAPWPPRSTLAADPPDHEGGVPGG
jgi:hypothetical protein